MPIEHASTRIVHKPWGRQDLRPWLDMSAAGEPIGEIWFERADARAPRPALLLKLLFTSERLSIQVHPGDGYAQGMGEPNGKSEAWYVLAADPDGAVALGLERELDASALRRSIEDGSIADLVAWRPVHPGDVVPVPAGTIHAIGAGLVIAEVQQRSDATFRMFDYGRRRTLHVEDAVAVALAGPSAPTPRASRPDDARTLLVANDHFVFEKIDLPPMSPWRIEAACEMWLLVVSGDGEVGTMTGSVGEAFFLDEGDADIRGGPEGLSLLVAYAAARPDPALLSKLGGASERPVPLGRSPSISPSTLAPLPVDLTKARQ